MTLLISFEKLEIALDKFASLLRQFATSTALSPSGLSIYKTATSISKILSNREIYSKKSLNIGSFFSWISLLKIFVASASSMTNKSNSSLISWEGFDFKKKLIAVFL